MRKKFTAALGGLAVVSAAAVSMTIGSGNALAASTIPSYEPDSISNGGNAQGTLSFYDNNGNQITSGSFDDSGTFAPYSVANSAAPAGIGVAKGGWDTPVDGTLPITWPGYEDATNTEGLTPSYYAAHGYPASLSSLTVPVIKNSLTLTLADHINDFPTASKTDPNIYQVRITGANNTYWVADIAVSNLTTDSKGNVTGGNWNEVYGTINTAVSAITATPTSPAIDPASVTFSSTLTTNDGSTAPAGTVNVLKDGTAVGTANYTPATGAISYSIANPAEATHSYSFQFVPTDTFRYNGASSAALSYTVTAPPVAVGTTTVVSASAASIDTTSTSTITAAVTTATGTPVTYGSVQFTLDGASVGSPVAVATSGAAAGTATYTFSSSVIGSHQVLASYIPASPYSYPLYLPSSDTSTTDGLVTVTAPSNPTDPQSVKVKVPQGELVISTPYTPSNPFDLGTMTLSADGTTFNSTPVTFGSAAAAGAADSYTHVGQTSTNPGTVVGTSTTNGVTVTDTRAASTGWKASIGVNDFSDGVGHTIDGNGLTFSGITPKFLTGNNLNSGNVTNVASVTAFKTAKQFAAATAGPGTVDFIGQMSLTAPSSTIAGTYTATITFSIV